MNMLPASILYRKTALAVACGIGLSLSFQADVAAAGAEAWREFARRSMMPDYSWNDALPAEKLAPSVRDVSLRQGFQSVTLRLSDAQAKVQESLHLAFGQRAGLAPAASVSADGMPLDFQSRMSPLSQQFMDATFVRDAGRHGRFGVTALVARQQFATPGFGVGQEWLATRSDRDLTVGESVTGQGVRVDYRLPLSNGLSWGWSAQSRLDMNNLDSVRGIYAEPGDFDLPARMGTQVEWSAFRNVSFALGMERVYYSDITPFTSVALPARLLSLMADGGAPAFAWQDQSVYSFETRVADAWSGEWLLRYSSRQQPRATAEIYRQALASEYSDANLLFGYRRHMRQWGELAFTASYASSMAFLGAGPVFAAQTYARGAVAEFEASWRLAF